LTFGKKMKAKLIGLLIGTVITPVALFLAVASAGAGHGDYVLARALYPFSILSTHLTDSITVVGLALACAQFPLYGWFFGAACEKKKTSVALITTSAHAVAVALTFVYPNGFAQ